MATHDNAPDTERSESLGKVITFYSYTGGIGRTMAMANAAWILASNRLRVLAVDWHLDSPGLQNYFHPFLRDKNLRSSDGVMDMIRGFSLAAVKPHDGDEQDWHESYADVMRYAVSLDWTFPDPGVLDFLPAGRQDSPYSRRMNTFDWNAFYVRHSGGVFIDSMVRSMRRHYDYVLVNSQSGLSAGAGICTLQLPDLVANCFAMNNRSIDGAATVAETIRGRADRTVRVLPVPLRVDDTEQIRLTLSRGYARQRFESFLDHHDQPADQERYWNDVEIPYDSGYAHEEILAIFGDRTHQGNTLLAAYERLVGVLTEGAVTRSAPVEDESRRRVLAEFERSSSLVTNEIVISFARADKVWADWVKGELTNSGLAVTLQDVGSGLVETNDPRFAATKILVLLSRDYLRSPNAADVCRIIAGLVESDLLVLVQLDGAPSVEPFDVPVLRDMVRLTEEQCRERLLAAVGHTEDTGRSRTGANGSTHRYPTTPPPVSKLPQRNPLFTGRVEQLANLRDALSGNASVAPQALFGLGGVGKTQIVLEYAYRSAAQYDVIWWISAEQFSQARNGMIELADRLGLPSGSNATETVQAVLDALRHGRPHRRWLLIFDNADDPDILAPLLPTGSGHLIITTRNHTWTDHADTVRIGMFTRPESVACLQSRVPWLTERDADQVAERLGDLPLAIEQAGAWLVTTQMPASRYLGLLDRQLPRILGENPPPGYETTAAASWLLSLNRLRKTTAAAARLLELCAFFSPEPIPLWLISSDRFISVLLDDDPSLRDPLLQGRMIREIGRYALANIDEGQRSIQIHRLVQGVIRSSLNSEEQLENQDQVHKILAAANPKDADEPDSWSIYRQLWPHLVPTGTLRSAAPEVRQLVVDMVRFLWKRNDYTGSQELAEQALGEWSRAFPEEDPTTLLLRVCLANSIRSQADYRKAYELDLDTMHKLRSSFGTDHPYALMAASGLAADMRALGDYEEAHKLDDDTFNRLEDVFGENHPRTLMAAHNLAVSMRLVGDFRGATQRDQLTLERRRRVLGEKHPYTLFSANDLGRDLRDMGLFQRSRQLLETTLDDYREVVGPEQAETLWTAKSLAVTLRKLGEFTAARTLTEQTLALHEKLHGDDHPDTLACLMNLGCDMSSLNRNDRAKEIVEDVYERYRAVLGVDHPFTIACANNLSIFVRKTGDDRRARTLSEDVVAKFRTSLGDSHPYTLACRVNLINDLHAAGEYQTAARMDEEVYALTVRALGEDHPDALASANNLSISRRSMGNVAGWRELHQDTLERSRRVLGEDHPNTRAVRDGERLNCDIEPPPT